MNAMTEGQGSVPDVAAARPPGISPTRDFCVVGIGASAGGLEALEALLHEVPSDTGMAFVVLHQLPSDEESHLHSLLDRQTKLPMQTAEDGMRVQPNHVYLNPPTKGLIVSGQRLMLTDKLLTNGAPERDPTPPIDRFFASLAQDIGRCCVAVVLSGTGSDGSRGVRAIHDVGGLVIAQSEESTQFADMPRSAERTGCVDLILPPQAIPAAIVRLARKFSLREGLSKESEMTDRKLAERRLAVEHAVSQVLINTQDLDSAAPQILSSFCRALEVDVCELWLPDPRDGQLLCAYQHSNLSGDAAVAFREASRPMRFAPGEGLVGNVFERREPMWSTNLAHDPTVRRAVLARDAGFASLYAFPLMLHREPLGVLCFATSEKLPPSAALLEMMNAVGHDLGQFVRRSRFEHELSEARKAADAANEAKSAFLANMSHEIRTPMTSVVGLTELLLASEPDSSRIEMLRMIQRSGHHLVELINDILDLSKIESGKLAVDRIDCSPVELVYDLASVMGVRAKEKGLTFEVRFDGRLPATIFTDPMRLRQILINLIGNAIKFTNQGGVRIVTRYLADLQSPRIEFEVSDTGIGMSAAEVSRLFEPFSQIDHSVTRRFGGTGLGLCISQRLAGALQGEIFVASEPNDGSTFRLQIATALSDDSALIDPAQHVSPLSTPSAGRAEIALSCHALIAEDTRGIQYLIKRFLEGAGAQVSLASNGQEALQRLHEAAAGDRPIDVVIMDMHMPVLSGYDAVARLRDEGSQVPIIALTARAMQGDREKCLSIGCNAYLPKPVDRMQLLEAVAKEVK